MICIKTSTTHLFFHHKQYSLTSHSNCFILQVCRRFNEVGSKMLSRGFIQVERRHTLVYKRVKSMLPRRESERRMHPLARYCDILSAIETRISMLNMTFMKYIDNGLCCFIPGKVITILLWKGIVSRVMFGLC